MRQSLMKRCARRFAAPDMTGHKPGAAEGGLRVSSYNIRKCLGIDRHRNPERTLRVITATGADIVALQESDRRLAPRPAALPASLIERESDYRAVPIGSNAVSLGWHGNAILVRPWVEVKEYHLLNLPSFEPRGAVVADLHVKGRNSARHCRSPRVAQRGPTAPAGPYRPMAGPPDRVAHDHPWRFQRMVGQDKISCPARSL